MSQAQAPVTASSVDILKKRAKKGGTWIALGYGAGQALRLGSNLILTRLLAPEIFGIVALVQAFLSGLEMFSDAGIGLSIVQSKSGTSDRFLNTAWTMQVLRGTLIALVACVLAPVMGNVYDEPALPLLLIVSSAGSLAKSFAATSMFTATRDLLVGRLTAVELSAQVLGLTTALSWAYFDPSPWALVASAVVANLATAGMSHLFLQRRKHSFSWNRESVGEIARFGVWIFLGSMAGFLANHADRLIVGKLFSMTELGMYSLATMLVRFVVMLYQKVNRSLLFPVYSATIREKREDLGALVRKMRLRVFPVFILALIAFVVAGDVLVAILFDDRYLGAGYMLQLLALSWLLSLCFEIGPVMLACGDSKVMTSLITTQVVIQLSCMVGGGLAWGTVGLLGGLVASRIIFYPIRSTVYNRYGLWSPGLDATFLGGALILGGALYQVRELLLPYLSHLL